MLKCLLITNGRKESEKEFNSIEDLTIGNYYIPCVEAALGLNYEVYVGLNKRKANSIKCSNYPVNFRYLGIYRNIYDIRSIYKAYKNLALFLKENKVDMLHCNSPIGGLLGRLSAKIYRVNKVIYTAHGFHFYKGAPLINRVLFYWIEKFLAYYTDVIITINNEDYLAALKLNKKWIVRKVHGVGIDKIDLTQLKLTKENIGLTNDDIIIISVGDLNKNKNNILIIEAMAHMKIKVHYCICGEGSEQKKLRELVKKYNLIEYVHFLGYREDINELLNISDIFVMPSIREGLSRSLMEAMSLGLPCVVSKIRGNTDLIKNNEGGFLYESKDFLGFANALDKLSINKSLRLKFGEFNKQEIKPYYLDNVKIEINNIYKEIHSLR
tara:strand:+ start:3745 stop:4890 length:1146 start_codon:yes stop_codon:yes gene_type:complete